jgi:ribosomal 30S subunit maturation factor RimM
MTAERERIKRQISYGEFPGESPLNTAWSVTHYVHVGGTKYPVRAAGEFYCVNLLGWTVRSRTLGKMRDVVIEALVVTA